MKRTLIAAVTIVGLAGVFGLVGTGFAGGLASSAASQYGAPPPVGGPAQDSVSGGGRYGGATTDGSLPFFVTLREFSIDAHSSPTGSGAYGTVFIGNPANGRLNLGGEVTCLQVAGNSAVAGGYVRESSTPEGVGRAFFVFFEDQGQAGAGTLDRSSATFMDLPDSPDLPAGFPRRCPLLDTNAFGVGYVPFTAGSVVIHDE